MRDSRLPAHAVRTCILILVSVVVTLPGGAAITTSPPSSTIAPGDAAPLVTLTATVAPGPSVANAVFTGIPPGASVVPGTVVLLFTPTGVANATFEIVTTSATPPGIYPITITTLPDYGAGAGLFTLVVGDPDFQTIVAPNPPSIAWSSSASVRVTTVPQFGFNSGVTYSFIGFPSGISASGPQTAVPPYAPLDFQIAVAARTPPGLHSGTLVASWVLAGPQTRTIPLSVIVQPPTLTLAFTPPSLTVAAGGPSVASAIVLTPGNGYTGTPTMSWGAIPSGVEITPLALASPALPPGQSIAVSVRATAAVPGSYAIAAQAADPGAAVNASATLMLTVAPPPDATLAVTPPALAVTAGQQGTVTVTATGINGFNGTLDVFAPNIPGIAFSPAAFALDAGASRQVSVQPSITAVPGTSAATFSATSTALVGSRTAALAITVMPPPPELTSATPPALTAGSKGVAMRLVGSHFRQGATVTFTPPGPVVVSIVVASSTLATLIVDTPAATPVGQYRVELRNPDRASTAGGLPVLVVPPSSLGAPLSVPTAAIVFPRPYAAVTVADPVYPRAVLATTGVGTIVGTWRFDGAPFDQFVVAASGGYPVEVTAKMPIPVATAGEHRLELAVEQPQQLTTEPVPVIVSIESNSGLRILEPGDGESIVRSAALFRWTIVPGASGYAVELARDDDRPSRTIRLSDSHWSPDEKALASLGAGKARIRVYAVFPGDVRGRPTAWREFVVPESSGGPLASSSRRAGPSPSAVRLAAMRLPESDSGQSQESPAAVAQPVATEQPQDWALTLLGSASGTDEDVPSVADAARLQLTTVGDIRDVSYFTKWTGDLSGRKDLDPKYDTAQENRAWQLELGALQARSREELRAGYSPPEFLDQSEFLAAGLARGGILGKVTTTLGSLSLYDTFHDDAAGAVSAYDLTQRITAAAWEAPGDTNRSLLRVFGMRARGSATEDGPQTEAEAIGFLWRFVASPSLTFVVEGAEGTLDGVSQANGDDYDGIGVRFGAAGAKGTFTWGLNVRDVDADLVNPANLGISVGGVPDRTGGDLTLGKSFGSTMLSLQLRTQRSGTLADGSGQSVEENAAMLTVVAPVNSRFVASATASATTTKGDANPDYELPGSDRSMIALGLTLSETIGSMSLAETIVWQELTDDVTSAFDSTVTSGSLTAGGAAGSAVTLSALLSGTRSESPQPVGTTDLWLASLQPALTWTAASLALTPRASYTRVESELGGTSEGEQYALVLQWSPPWWEAFFNLQLGADWSRTSTEGLPTPGFDQRLVASLTLRWGLSRSKLVTTPPTPLPVPPAYAVRRNVNSNAEAR